MTHICGVEKVPPHGQWRAWCSTCGWLGELRDDHLIAAADAGDHKQEMEEEE